MTKILKNGEFTYDVADKLGEGAFGAVYRGVITKTNQVVAIKALSLDLIKKYGSDIKGIIINEVSVLKDISNKMLETPCPFIIKIYDCFLTEHYIYLVLQFCGQGNLQNLLDKRRSVPQEQAIEILYHIVRALDFLAIQNVVHRDLKPQNIFLKKSKNIMYYKLGDFGFAVNKQKNEEVVGTYPYMSPQIFNYEEYGNEVDVWAFGVIAHQILFGQLYFIGTDQFQIKQNVLNMEYKIKKINTISKNMADLLFSCLKKDKADRISAKKLRSHPVFKEIDEKYKTQSSSNLFNPVNILKKLYNEINKAIFSQQLARRILLIQRQNYISIYLIKKCIYHANQIVLALSSKTNFIKENENDWKTFLQTPDYANYYGFVYKTLEYTVNLYKSEFQVFRQFISKFPQENQQILFTNLGKDLYDNVNQDMLNNELQKFVKYFSSLNDNESQLLAQECIIMLKYNNINYDFYQHLKQRKTMNSSTLKSKIDHL